MSKKLLEDVADLALVSGGCIKFDLKSWNENLHIALTGVTNRRALKNFEWLAKWIPSRLEPFHWHSKSIPFFCCSWFRFRCCWGFFLADADDFDVELIPALDLRDAQDTIPSG